MRIANRKEFYEIYIPTTKGLTSYKIIIATDKMGAYKFVCDDPLNVMGSFIKLGIDDDVLEKAVENLLGLLNENHND